MEIQYYYLRLAEYDFAAGKEGQSSWIPCSKERALKRFEAACETESFNNYVVTVSETETEITIQDIEINGLFLARLTLCKGYVFGGEGKEERAQAALKIFEDIADTCVSIATAQ